MGKVMEFLGQVLTRLVMDVLRSTLLSVAQRAILDLAGKTALGT